MKRFMSKRFRRLGIPLLLIMLLNTAATGFGFWLSHPVAVLVVNLVVFLYLADAGAGLIPARNRRSYERALSIGFPLLLVLAWELIARAGILNPRWFPPPTKILAALWDLTVSYDPYNRTSLLGRPWLIPDEYRARGWDGVLALFSESHLLATLVRVFAGFFLGSLPGVVVGVAMGMSRTVRLMLDATLSAIYVLPKIAIFPIMMLLFADPFGEGPKIAVVAISAFFLVTINTMAGVRGIDRVYLEAGRNFGANRWQMLRHVIIPGALPVIAAGLRLALGTALVVIVAIEFVRARKGVGFLTFYYWEILVTEKMYAGLLVVMVLGVSLTHGLQWLERRLMPWKEEGDRLPPPG